MVKVVGGRNSEERNRFWKAYRACVEENRVCPDRSLYYETFEKLEIVFVKGESKIFSGERGSAITAKRPPGQLFEGEA